MPEQPNYPTVPAPRFMVVNLQTYAVEAVGQIMSYRRDAQGRLIIAVRDDR